MRTVKVRLLQSLHFKVAAGVISTVILLSTLNSVWDYRFYKMQLLHELEQSATNLSDVILDSLLEIAMIGEHPQLLQPALERLGADSSVLGISLLDNFGVVDAIGIMNGTGV